MIEKCGVCGHQGEGKAYRHDCYQAFEARRKLQTRMLCAAAKLGGMTKRGYSREFKPHGDTGKRYLLDDIPAGLWREVREKAKREGLSLRALILKLLTEWLKT